MATDAERLSVALKESLKRLDEAYRLIKTIPLEPKKQNCIDIGEAVGLIIQVQKHLGDSFPKLRVESADDQERSEGKGHP
ncbi:MAG: hypothetical protein R6X15_09500 [Pseudomonadota bacterium]